MAAARTIAIRPGSSSESCRPSMSLTTLASSSARACSRRDEQVIRIATTPTLAAAQSRKQSKVIPPGDGKAPLG